MKPQGRLQFIDLHRGLAILVMIEVHVFNAFIIPAMKGEPWFKQLNFVNGLVAPSFLFISGFAFILAAEKKMADFKQFGSAFWRQLSRIFLIWFVGYTLRVPFFSLQRSLYGSSEQQTEAFFSVDVLQTIAIGLLLLFILRLIISNFSFFKYLTLSVTILAGISAPWIWRIDFHSFMHPFFANYFTPSHGSLFPLFPWIGFIFAGAFLCMLFIEFRQKDNVQGYFKFLAILSGILIITGHLLIAKETAVYLPMPDPHFFFFTMRVGYVSMVLAICYLVTLRFDVSKWFFVDVSRESLLVYWLHLQLIYRKWATDRSAADIINCSFGITECIIATIVLTAAMVIVAMAWTAIKAKDQKKSRYISWAFIGIPLIIFALR